MAVLGEAMRANSGAEARALRALFGGDKRLMDRYLANVFTMLRQNNDLLQYASPASIIEAIRVAANMGLEPGTDDGAIVRRGSQAVFQPMYRGYLKRIRNSGKIADLDCQLVYENDFLEMGFGTEPFIRHTAASTVKDESGNIISDRGGYRGVYAWARPVGSVWPIIEWMEEAEINLIRDTYSSTHTRDGKPLPWATSYGEMARKTVIRRLAKRLPAEAVDHLLAADAVADETERALKEETSSHMDDLRRLALRAVEASSPPALPEGEATNTEPPAAPETDETPPVAADEAATASTPEADSDPLWPLNQEPPTPSSRS